VLGRTGLISLSSEINGVWGGTKKEQTSKIYVVTRRGEKELIELACFCPMVMLKSHLNKHPELKELLE